MSADIAVMILLGVAVPVAVLILGHSEAARDFNPGWVSAAMLSCIMVLTWYRNTFLLVMTHDTTRLLELLTGQESHPSIRQELAGTIQRMHRLIKELSYHDD